MRVDSAMKAALDHLSHRAPIPQEARHRRWAANPHAELRPRRAHPAAEARGATRRAAAAATADGRPCRASRLGDWHRCWGEPGREGDGHGRPRRRPVVPHRHRPISAWVREAASAAVCGRPEASACGQAVRAVPPGRVQVGRVVWPRVRARSAAPDVLGLPLGSCLCWSTLARCSQACTWTPPPPVADVSG